MKLNESLTSIKGIGPKRAEALGRLGLFTLRDILFFAPREHYDLREAKRIRDLEHGEYGIIKIESIDKPKLSYPIINGRRTSLVTVKVSDGTDEIRLSWYNQPYAKNSIPEFAHGFVYGRVDRSHGCVMVNAVFRPQAPGMLPVYPLAKGIGQVSMRACVNSAIAAAEGVYGETLPDGLRMKHGLCQLGFAIENLHFPLSPESLGIAKRRLSFENTLNFTILLEALRSRTLKQPGISFKTDGLVEEFSSLLPFRPTGGQIACMEDIARDMAWPKPMNRLIQGDVGSGKTVLAIFAMYAAAKNGYQSALMAPTAMLAEQHYRELCRYFGDRVLLLTGGMKKSEQKAALERIRAFEVSCVVGTHSLIEDGVEFCRLGLVITDEQHRFGVRQRAVLDTKGETCDVLIMSATPIPRTLSLILYGDLDVSLLKDMPAGRKPVITRYVPPDKRSSMYRYIEEQITARGIQAFVVCPMIEDNDEVRYAYSAEAVYEELLSRLNVRVGLVHGRMKAEKREAVMEDFRRGELDLLVSTTVIEVGVDVPNACIMAVESAERFGLAQLHQLRGRVGRSDKESYCFLLSESRSETAAERIKTLVESNDGFRIAEKDLETRGPGELLGRRQHGTSELLDALSLADMATLNEAKAAAESLMQSGDAQDRALVRGVLSRYAGLLQDIAIN